MNAKEYLKALGHEWDIENYTEMWVPGGKLPEVLEGYHQAKSKEEAEERLEYDDLMGYIKKRWSQIENNVERLNIDGFSIYRTGVEDGIELAAFGKEGEGFPSLDEPLVSKMPDHKRKTEQ